MPSQSRPHNLDMSRFIPADRDTAYLLPPSVNEWLPDDHLARFVVEVIEQLDLGELTRAYAGRGSAAHHPAVLLGLLVYGYASGVHSSRKIERATYDSVAFRYVAANTHPDHDTLASFRRRFLKEIESLFVQVLVLAREMKLLKLGHIALDGTKIAANASKHRALSWGHAGKIEAQLRGEVQTLRSNNAQPSATAANSRSTKPRWPHVRPREMQARSHAARSHSRHKLAPGTATRSTSPMNSRASCPSRAGASSKATTRRRAWTPRP